ncbi:hypothetical protein [Pseudonocardia sp. DLS-67]
MEDRYREVVTELLSLAAEATIRGNDYETPGFILWETLGKNMYVAVANSVEGIISDAEFREIAAEADIRAIERIGELGLPD